MEGIAPVCTRLLVHVLDATNLHLFNKAHDDLARHYKRAEASVFRSK